MCGISGIFAPENPERITQQRLIAMTRAIGCRGPDQAGVYLHPPIGLAHARLSIIDLAGGLQPIPNEDRTLWIVYNGEVYNYRELRQDLLKRGHTFRTQTDTEVLLHHFEEKGPDFLRDLNGQFALAIWDSRKKTVFLARDRTGIRPLYYAMQERACLFASEAKALFATGLMHAEIDEQSVRQAFQYWSPLPGKSMFKGVREILPGHYAILSQKGLDKRPYWDLPCPSGRDTTLSRNAAAEKTVELLKDAIRLRLRADVPVGAYLSGGMDSSGVAAIVKGEMDANVQTFGLRFESDDFDEGSFQEQMVQHLQVRHNSLWVDNASIGRAFPDVVWHSEKTLLRTAPVPMYLLSGLVQARGLKVVLTGEGADEVFGGYHIFKEAKIREFWSRRPKSPLGPALLPRIYPYVFRNKRMATTLKHFFSQAIDTPRDPFFSHMVRWQNMERLRHLLHPRLRETSAEADQQAMRERLPAGFEAWPLLSRARYLEMRYFMSPYLLSSQGDRVAMAHSIEIRLPFLDHRLIEWAASLPDAWHMQGIHEKHLLKKVFRPLLPHAVINRPKHPYRAPAVSAFLKGSQPDWLQDVLTPQSIQVAGFFHYPAVEKLLRRLRQVEQPSELDSMALVGILSTQLLHQQYVREKRFHQEAQDWRGGWEAPQHVLD